jgi:peptidoglycan/LPS O-acetylase OafA/YrhL
MQITEEQWQQQVTGSVNTLIDNVEKIQRFQAACEADKRIAVFMQLNEKQMGHAANYTNLILVAGYAGFFGFWTTLAPRLPGKLYAVTGLLALLSLITFITWEIVKMIWGQRHLSKTNSILTDHRFAGKQVEMYEAALALYAARSNKVWPWFLIPTLVTGGGAGVLLIGCFCHQLWQAFHG